MSGRINKGNAATKTTNPRSGPPGPKSGQANQAKNQTVSPSPGKSNKNQPASGKPAPALASTPAKSSKTPVKSKEASDPTDVYVKELLEEQNRQLLTRVRELEEENKQLKEGTDPNKGEKKPESGKTGKQNAKKDIIGKSTKTAQPVDEEKTQLREKVTEKDEIDRLEDKTKKQNKELQKYRDEQDKHVKDLEKVKAENEKLHEKLKELEKNSNDTKVEDKDKSKLKEKTERKEKIEKEKSELQNRCDQLVKERDDLQMSKEKVENEMKELQKRSSTPKGQNNQSKPLTDAKKKIETFEKENAELSSELDKTKKDRSDDKKAFNVELNKMTVTLSNKEDEIGHLKEDVAKLKQEAKNDPRPPGGNEQKLKDEVESLRNRLSQMAGAKLTDNNPAIADLSDSNRPMKLGENFSELYDNEWTDALEEMMDKFKLDEEKAIEQLLKIVKEAYAFCAKKAKTFTDNLKSSLRPFMSDKDTENLPPEMSKLINDHRKAMAVFLVEGIQKEFLGSKVSEGKKTSKYKEKCVTLCWFMTIQSPPVYFDAKALTGKFDTNFYKAYTKSGKSFHYLVWPALYLHEGGPLLGKGVAQGK